MSEKGREGGKSTVLCGVLKCILRCACVWCGVDEVWLKRRCLMGKR